MRIFMGTALAAGLLLAAGGASWGQEQDTVRLGGPTAQASISGGTDTELVRGYYRGGYRGGYYGGYRGFYGGGYYRPYYYASFYRPYYYGGYYSPYYYGSYYSPYYYGSYYSPYYGGGYYGGAPYYGSYYGCNGTNAPVMTAQATYQAPVSQPYAATTNKRYGEQIPPPLNSSTFQYDGGPRQIVPIPGTQPSTQPTPNVIPNRIMPIDGRLVSMPTSVGGGMSTVGIVNARTASDPSRIAYPAYGEAPIPVVPRR